MKPAMPKQIPTQIPECAANLIARPEWFADTSIVFRVQLRHATGLARFLSGSRFTKRAIIAITLGYSINYREIDGFDDQTPAGLALLAHELKHVEQIERDGRIGFYLKYLRDYLRFGYGEKIPYEAEAYALQRKIRMHLKREFSDNHPIHPCITPTEYVKITPDPFQFPEALDDD
jgi:hypothetical protein